MRPATRPPAWHSKHGTRVVIIRMTDAMDDLPESAGQDNGDHEYLEVLRRELKVRVPLLVIVPLLYFERPCPAPCLQSPALV